MIQETYPAPKYNYMTINDLFLCNSNHFQDFSPYDFCRAVFGYRRGSSSYSYNDVKKGFFKGASTVDMKSWYSERMINANMIVKGMKVDFHSSCMMPRNKSNDILVKTNNVMSADFHVIPRIDYNISEAKIYPCAVFVDESSRNVLMFKPRNESDKKILKSSIGKTIGEIDKNIAEYVGKFSDSYKSQNYYANMAFNMSNATLVYCGRMMRVSRHCSHFLSYYDHPDFSFIYENDLYPFLMNENNSFKIDELFECINMIKAPDEETRDLGLKTLSNLDYASYPKLFSYILNNNRHDIRRCYKARNHASVKYMMTYLENVYVTVGKWKRCDLEAFCEFMTRKINDDVVSYMRDSVSRFKDVEISLNTNSIITPKENVIYEDD